jgi:AmiR/NasT family two-component response regulator
VRPRERRHALRLLSDQAAAALANASVYQSASELATQLSNALEHRAVIEQAKGMLMALQHCDDDQAFDILRRASQRSNRKLRDVAAELIDRTKARNHDRPPPPPPRPPRG